MYSYSEVNNGGDADVGTVVVVVVLFITFQCTSIACNSIHQCNISSCSIYTRSIGLKTATTITHHIHDWSSEIMDHHNSQFQYGALRFDFCILLENMTCLSLSIIILSCLRGSLKCICCPSSCA